MNPTGFSYFFYGRLMLRYLASLLIDEEQAVNRRRWVAQA
ncbi:MAG: hypothetical protein ACI97A_001612 [Planctomycetota bacterium]|jgi:hypothetical protein